MKKIIDYKNIDIAHEGGKVLDGAKLSLNAGDFVLLLGPSGAGKTVLLRELAKSIKDSAYVGSDPSVASLMDTVRGDIAFSLEERGMEPQQIRRRVAEVAIAFDVVELLDRRVADLSLGQRQLIALCAAAGGWPRVLLLDEPLSCLDPAHKRRFVDLLVELNRKYKITIVIAEHDLRAFIRGDIEIFKALKNQNSFDKTRYVCESKITNNQTTTYNYYNNSLGENEEVCAGIYKKGCEIIDEVFIIEDKKINSLGDMNQAQDTLAARRDDFSTALLAEATGKRSKSNREIKLSEYSDIILSGENLSFSYGDKKNELHAVSHLDIQIRRGSINGIVGPNGSGKSTLLGLLSGVLKPRQGRVRLGKNTRLCHLIQSEKLLFNEDSILASMKDGLAGFGEGDDLEAEIVSFAKTLGLEHLLGLNPRDASGGELKLCAIMLALLTKPDLLLLDEPSKGLDPSYKKRLRQLIFDINKGGTTVVIVSHDLNFIASISDFVHMSFEGEIIASDENTKFWKENLFYKVDL